MLVKPTATPVHAKKQRPDFELGVAPLPQDSYKTSSVSSAPAVKQAVATFARPDAPTASQTWDFTQTLPVQPSNESSVEKSVVRDTNHNIYIDMWINLVTLSRSSQW